MTRKSSIFAMLLAGVFLASCSTSNSVVSNRLISKRKYTKGFHLNKKSHFGSKDESVADKGQEQENSYMSGNKELATTRNQSSNNGNTTEGNTETIIETEFTSTMGTDNGQESINKGFYSDNIEQEAPIEEIVTKIDQSGTEKEELAENNFVPVVPPSPGSTLDIVIAILLCLFIPPLGMLIYRGVDNLFWLDLVLFLIAIGGFFFLPFIGLVGLAAVVIAFLAVWDII